MKVNYILIFLFLSFFYNSCKKENQDDLTPVTFEATKIFAGVSDTSLLSYTFINPISVEITYDSSNLYGYGTATIDFDLNGVTDMTIVINIINQDSIHLLNGNAPNPLPSCSIESSTSISLAMLAEEVVTNGSPITYFWCDTLGTGKEINSDLDWSNVTSNLNLWSQSDGITFGSWSLIEGISYIGFRFHDKYGWLEVNAIDPLNPLFTRFSMQR